MGDSSSLLYSSFFSSSGNAAVPLRLLTRAAKRPGEVGGTPVGKCQKSAPSWGRAATIIRGGVGTGKVAQAGVAVEVGKICP